jgi:hypothetical protein
VYSYPFGNGTPAQGAVLNSYKDQSLHGKVPVQTDFGVDFDIE